MKITDEQLRPLRLLRGIHRLRCIGLCLRRRTFRFSAPDRRPFDRPFDASQFRISIASTPQRPPPLDPQSRLRRRAPLQLRYLYPCQPHFPLRLQSAGCRPRLRPGSRPLRPRLWTETSANSRLASGARKLTTVRLSPPIRCPSATGVTSG